LLVLGNMKIQKSDTEIQNEVQELYGNVAVLIKQARTRVAITANAELALLHWRVGVFINQFVLHGNRAPYGKQIIAKLSALLIENFNSGWSVKQLMHCLRSAESFSEEQIISAVQRQLSWTHLKTISYEKDPLKRIFYLEMAINQQWNTRTLADQIDKMLFERTAIAKKTDEQIEKALTELTTENQIQPDLFFKNTYILDFLGIQKGHSERDLENALLANLEAFILELGNGFAFVERQKRMSIDAVDYHLDLLFYHRKLKRLIAIDLKLGKFKPEFKAQMELYLRWLERFEMEPNEEKPIGLLLCSEGNTEHIELLMLDEKDIKVAQYLTELPSKAWFADKLHRAIAIAKMNQTEATEN
jgi:predicted nuclease of restriction endonuclease-like (RecB) superfamily